MKEMPVNEGLEEIAAFPFDLQLFADGEESAGADAGGEATGDMDTGFEDEGADVSEDGSNQEEESAESYSGVVAQGTEDEELDGKGKQSPEANAAFAKMRKEKEEAERRALVAKEEIQKQRDQEFANRFGKSHGIFTEQQYWAAVDREQQIRQQQQQQNLEQLPKQIYQQLISEGYDPKVADGLSQVQAGKIQLAQMQQQLKDREKADQKREATARQQATQAQFVAQINADYNELTKKYGDMIPKLEEMDDATVALMKNGLPLKAAWLTAHEDEVIEFAKKGGVAKALRNVNSKSHMKSESGGAGDFGTEVALSPEQLRVWHAMGYSSKEARKREAKYAKRGK